MTRPVKPFILICPVVDGFHDDPEAMQAMREHATAEWRDRCLEEGGEPLGELTVETVFNPRFGWVLTDEDGSPIRHEDGTVATDMIRQYLYVRGRAITPGGAS